MDHGAIKRGSDPGRNKIFPERGIAALVENPGLKSKERRSSRTPAPLFRIILLRGIALMLPEIADDRQLAVVRIYPPGSTGSNSFHI
jgi:hypothetical protein